MYYECQPMHCAKTINSNIRSLDRDKTYNIRNCGMSLWPSSLHLILNIIEVWEHISIYTKMTFLYQNNIFKGILRIFSSLERSNKTFR